MTFIVIFFIFGVCSVFINFYKDSGNYGKAKIAHGLITLFTVISGASSFWELINFYENFETSIKYYSKEVGVFSAEVNLFALYFSQVYVIILFLIALMMTARSKIARRWFLRILPIGLLIYIANIYRGYFTSMLLLGHYNFTYAFWVVAIDVAVIVSVIKIYSSNFMKEFYGLQLAPHQSNILDE